MREGRQSLAPLMDHELSNQAQVGCGEQVGP